MAKLKLVSGVILPDAPYPRTTKAKGLHFRIDYERLFASTTWVTARDGDIRNCLLRLWLEAWRQIPAGSIPDDDEYIAALIEKDVSWVRANKDHLLRGFTEHADGRLYHGVIIEQVLAAIDWKTKEAQRKRAYRDGKKCPTGQTRDRRGTDMGVRTPEPEPEPEPKETTSAREG